MTKFSDSNYDILKDYFIEVIGDGVGLGDSWLLGPKTSVITDGGISEILWEDNPTRGLVAHSFIIQEIDGNKFLMKYDGLISTFSLASSAFGIGNDFYFRKDSFFYVYLLDNSEEFRNYINVERTFCYFGKIWPVSNATGIWNIEFFGMKDYMESAIPTHNRTARLIEMMDVWFDQINHEPYNMTKYLWTLLDSKEVDTRWLGYIASIYGIEINENIDELTLREWVDLLVYFLKRVGTYNAIYIVYKVFTAHSQNKVNIYERWDEWCASGAGDIPSFKEFPNFFPGTRDFHWFEFYNLPPSGGAGEVWYSQFNPSGAPTPNPYTIDWDAYPTHALQEPSPSCSSVSAAPTGSMVITPHYITEIDLTTEPIGDRFNDSWILNEFYIDELVRNWEYVRPVGKYVQYQELISPASAQNRTGDPENLYPLSSLGYFNTAFTASQYLSGAAPTPSGGDVAFVYTQYAESDDWTITHGLDSHHIMVQVWTPTSGPSFLPMTRVIPDEIEIDTGDPFNTVHLTFDAPISGIANIAGYINGNITDDYNQVAPTNPWSVIHDLGTTAPSGYPTGSVVNYFTSPNKTYPDQVELINTNRTNATWDVTITGEAFTRNADYVHTQTIASSVWNINHQMNTDGTIIQCFNSSNLLIQPLTTIITDSNNITVTFENSQSGTAYLIYFKRDVISRLGDACDITGTGICAGGIGYWKVGDGGIEEYDPYVSNDLQSPTASGDYWRVWADADNYYIDFIVPTGEDLNIREVGLFNVDDILVYYSVCSELFKPKEVQTVFNYRSQQLWLTESSSSSSSSVSSSSSSSSLSSSSISSSSKSSSSSSSIFVSVLQCNFVPDDDFTGADFSAPDTDRWTVWTAVDGYARIQDNELRMYSNSYGGLARCTNNAQFDGDFNIYIEWAHVSSGTSVPIYWYINLKNNSNNYITRFNNGNDPAQSFDNYIYVRQYDGSWSTTYSKYDTSFANPGKIQFVRTGNSLSTWVEDHGSGLTLRDTMANFGTGKCTWHIEFPNASNSNFNTWRFDNFTLNQGIMSCSSSSISSSSSSVSSSSSTSSSSTTPLSVHLIGTGWDNELFTDSNSVTTTFTVPSASDRAVIVYVSARTNVIGNNTAATVYLGGKELTKIFDENVNDRTFNTMYMYVGYLLESDIALMVGDSFVVNWTNQPDEGTRIGFTGYENVDQITPIADFNRNSIATTTTVTTSAFSYGIGDQPIIMAAGGRGGSVSFNDATEYSYVDIDFQEYGWLDTGGTVGWAGFLYSKTYLPDADTDNKTAEWNDGSCGAIAGGIVLKHI